MVKWRPNINCRGMELMISPETIHNLKSLNHSCSHSMGFNILRIPPLSSSKSILVLSPKSKPIFSTLFCPLHSYPTSLCNTHFNILSSKSITPAISATRFSGSSIRRAERGFRGGIAAFAAPRSVQKSEEEWRAILSPEQFHILRQKGTE